MSRRVDTANRTVLTLLGLLLLGGGAVGLAASSGAFGDPPPVLPVSARRFEDDQPWFWWAVAGAGLLIALLALRWLLAQLHTDRLSRLDLTRDDREGRTVVHAGALTDAVEDEATALRGVSGASAHLRDSRGRRLSLTVDLSDHADIAEVRDTLEGRVVSHARQAVDDPDLPVDIELRPDRVRAAGRDLL